MNQTRFDRIDALLEGALAVEPAVRAAWLKEACGTDETLRREVEALLDLEVAAAQLPDHADLTEAFAEEAAVFTGQQISHYRIEERLGVGGMGEVWRAWDELLKRAVALKFLSAAFNADPERVRRFEQEANAASQLNHPNIITIHEIGEAGGAHFIATEYVEGQTLRHWLTNPATQQPRRLSVAQTLDFAIQIASALKAAHAAWIVHRDIKPENIMVRGDGLVKVLDFGIAKLNGRDGGGGMRDEGGSFVHPSAPILHPSFTAAGTILGTASYMSPEQARGEMLDGRTDVFSLGLVLYEMTTGARLLAGATVVDAAEILRGEQEPLPLNAKFEYTPKDLERIIRKTLRRDRAERYATAGELLDDLNKLKEQLANRASRRLAKVAAAGLLLAGLFVVAAAKLSVHETWEERVLRDGHTAAVRRAVFSPDGRLLVSVGEDKQVIVWDFAERRRLATFTDHQDWVTTVAFAPDGKWFATASADGSVIVWDAVRLAKAAVLPGHHGVVRNIAFSADGRTLVTPTEDDRKNIWEVESWRKLREVRTYGFQQGHFLLSPYGRWMMVPYGDTYDLAEAEIINDARPYFWGNTPATKLTRPPAWSWAALAPDGRRMISIDGGGYVAFSEIAQFSQPAGRRLLSHQRMHRDVGRAVAFSSDGKLAASGAEDIVLWDALAFEKLTRFRHLVSVSGLAFSPDGRWLVSAHTDGAILVWSILEQELVAAFAGHSGEVGAVAFDNAGKCVASASEDGSVIVWDTQQNRKEAVLLWHPIRVNAVAFSADGKWLVSSDLDGNVAMWEMAGWKLRWSRKEVKRVPGEASYGAAVTPDGRWVATSYAVYDGNTGQLSYDFRAELPALLSGTQPIPQPTEIRSLGFTAGGQTLVTVSISPRSGVMTRQVGQWQPSETQRLKDRRFISLSLALNNQQFVIGEDAGIVQLWDIQPLQPVAQLGRHEASINAVAFSPNSREVVSTSDDKTITLWDAVSHRLITHIGMHTAPVMAVAFSADGNQLVAGGNDHSVRLYTRQRTLWDMNWD
jgi:WD40 repeat protein